MELTFQKYAVKMSGYKASFAYNYDNAPGGTTPDYLINYEKALVSRGDLPNANAPKASVTDISVFFTWEDYSGEGKALPNDNAVVVAYCEEKGEAKFSNGDAVRSAGAGTLDMKSFTEQKVQIWLALLSKDGRKASNSFYAVEMLIK